MEPFAEYRPTLTPGSLDLRSLSASGSAKQSLSANFKRIGRLLRRQALLFGGVFALTLSLGIAAAIWRGGDWALAAAWAPMGLILASVIVMAQEFERDAVYGVEAVERNSASQVASAAPVLESSALRALAPDMRQPMWAAVFAPASPFATSMRGVTRSLSSFNVIAVMGCVPGDGATTTASSLAAVASQQGKRVLLVDCDLRQRGMTRLMATEPQAGVFEAVEAPNSWASLLEQETETGLDVLPAARLTNPWGHLFGRSGFDRLMKEWRAQYDLIVLDCAPALSSADSAMIARLADASLLVVSWDDTSRSEIRATMRRLRQQNVSPVMVHMNRAPAVILQQIQNRQS